LWRARAGFLHQREQGAVVESRQLGCTHVALSLLTAVAIQEVNEDETEDRRRGFATRT